MSHTPTPWQVHIPDQRKVDRYQVEDRLIASADGKHIAETFQYQNHANNEANGTSIANAAFIVRACNAHEGLVEALEACMYWSHLLPTDVQESVQSALRKAQGAHNVQEEVPNER